ncbi:MAG TPA: leucyl aminopeptidase [Acidimicrobiia bacterium]|nr:leucyl aminopeptidase [Acidimicrobiia bacterium]
MSVFTGLTDFDPAPSLQSSASVTVSTKAVTDAPVVGYLVAQDGDVPGDQGLSAAALEAAGFEGKVGQTIVLPSADGPMTVLVGVGELGELDSDKLRDAGAAFARATQRQGELALTLGETGSVASDIAGQVLVEGALLARYRYDVLKGKPTVEPITELVLVVDGRRSAAVRRGAARGVITAEATNVARDLANTPPALLTALDMAELATRLGKKRGLDVEIFDKKALIELGCGGLLGVNAGSAEEPRMIRLTYRPAGSRAHLTFVGKGIMYDAGGMALKPADDVHATMKNDMSGAGAILAAMAQLEALGCKTAVTGYLMCTDNRPSDTSIAMGDVLTVYGGKTVEVMNTDAEGRLVMADALVIATEDETNAIVDIATLTGAAMRALGTQVAGLIGNSAELVAQVEEAAVVTGESVWELPLERRYRGDLNSDIADIKNLGGANAGAITAALFLDEFVAGKPWAHIDIAGTAQNDRDTSWRPPGCTGFGARLLVELALNFKRPAV